MGRTSGCDLPPESDLKWASRWRFRPLHGTTARSVTSTKRYPSFRLQSPRFAAATHPMVSAAAQQFLANAYALRGDREPALTLSRAVIPYLQRTQMVATLVPYVALLHVQQPGSETMPPC